MSFVNTRLELPGSAKQTAHQFKDCGRCKTSRPPEGGIQMSATRWVCAACWTRRAIGRKQ